MYRPDGGQKSRYSGGCGHVGKKRLQKKKKKNYEVTGEEDTVLLNACKICCEILENRHDALMLLFIWSSDAVELPK